MNCFEEIRLVFRLKFVFKIVFKTMFKTMSKTMFKTMSKTIFKTLFKTMFEKIKNIANKIMAFLKITDPKKRDFIVNEFLKTRQIIQKNFLSERVGDLSIQCELSKLFKPVTDMQNDLKEGLVSELKPIREGMKTYQRPYHFRNFHPQQPMMIMVKKKWTSS